MADNARGIHVSPGIYTRELSLDYAIRSLGITTLGVVGETVKGPAFQPMDIANWREFQDIFGSTSTEKFKGSQYPKYELPYIAKSYLSESEQLKVVRVLGLSGYNAGPAWVVTASANGGNSGTNDRKAVVVLRSRGKYKFYDEDGENLDCQCEPSKFDVLEYRVGEPMSNRNSDDCTKIEYNDVLDIKEYIPLDSNGYCSDYDLAAGTSSFAVSQTNRGRFKIVGLEGKQANGTSTVSPDASGYFEYAVSLNPNDKDYILKVLGTNPFDGDAPVYVETLYDVALEQSIAEGTVGYIDSKLTFYQAFYTADFCAHEPIDGMMVKPQSALRRKDVGTRVLANDAAKEDSIWCSPYDFATDEPMTLWEIHEKNMANALGFDLLNGDKELARIKHVTITNTNRPCGVSGHIYTIKTTVYSLTAKFNQVFSNLIGNTNSIAGNGSSVYSETSEEKCYEQAPEQPNNELVYKYDEPAYAAAMVGQIYTVRQYTTQDGKRHYLYAWYMPQTITENASKIKDGDAKINYYGYLSGATAPDNIDSSDSNKTRKAALVYNKADGLYYKMNSAHTNVTYVELDMNDYKSAYRHAMTPWIVSNLKGDFTNIEVNKMFRFHTISDGTNSNYEIKISIENIRPDEGVFDVVVRKIDDLDESIIPLEKFARCSMIPSDPNYIAFRIGSLDGVYESRSKYIVVEVADTLAAKNSVPAGFLGYPIPKYNGEPISGDPKQGIEFPTIMYNRSYDEDIKNRKQYFGLSSWVGVDIDNFTFKGNKTYIDKPEYLSRGFHLDSRLDKDARTGEDYKLTVDGEEGYKFDCVSTNNRTQILNQTPLIGKESEMWGSIYEYVNLRKFTVFFYGGFDGWDIYRDQRTNTDNFKMTQYRGYINQKSGEGYSFNKIQNPSLLELNQNGITSDFYAYLSAIRQFANPTETDINVFATPGIDYVNQKMLVQEAIEMVEEERADSIYVITTPDKPSGAGDYVDEMYTAEDAVYNLEDTEIDSNYSCTYYPWVKYLDVENNQYIYLPPTKDAVRNFALTDNQSYPWFAPAGIARGAVDCVRAHYVTKLADEDVLYDGRINPVKTFAQDGPKIWGQKNLQINENQLNRIAVRRLLLRMRKLIAIACIGLIFEPNDTTAKQTFISTVTPIMDSIRANRGITDYRIEVNDSLESRERRELPAKIYFKPINALEYISIDFILTPEGISFDDI